MFPPLSLECPPIPLERPSVSLERLALTFKFRVQRVCEVLEDHLRQPLHVVVFGVLRIGPLLALERPPLPFERLAVYLEPAYGCDRVTRQTRKARDAGYFECKGVHGAVETYYGNVSGGGTTATHLVKAAFMASNMLNMQSFAQLRDMDEPISRGKPSLTSGNHAPNEVIIQLPHGIFVFASGLGRTLDLSHSHTPRRIPDSRPDVLNALPSTQGPGTTLQSTDIKFRQRRKETKPQLCCRFALATAPSTECLPP